MGILKPAYNAIDMVELELLDDNSEPRQFSKDLLSVKPLDMIDNGDQELTLVFICLQVRQQIINQQNGSSYMMVKFHLDHKVITGSRSGLH